MRYALLIYGNESQAMKMSEKDQAADMAAWFKYSEELATAGVMLAGEALQPTQSATTLRVKQGKPVTFDGPFAETKEQFGGYYILQVKDLDEAIRWASKMPVGDGSVELRPVMEFDAMP